MVNHPVRERWPAERAAAEPSLLRRADLGLATPWEEPRTEAELKLSEIWGQVLGIDTVGASDDFFELGGDSLAATTLAAEIEATFGVQFGPSDVINFSTISKQATTVTPTTSSPRRQLPSNLVVGSVGGLQPPFFMVHGGLGFAFFQRAFIDEVGQDRPIYLFQAPGLDGRTKPLGSIEEIAGVYVALIRKVQPNGPYYIGGMCAGAFIALEMSIQLEEAGQSVAGLILLDPYPWPRALAQHYRRGTLRRMRKRWRSILRLSSPRRWAFTLLGASGWSSDSMADDQFEQGLKGRTEEHQRVLDIIRRRRAGDIDATSPKEHSYQPETMLKVAVQLQEALKRYVPRPYSGKASMLVSSNRAAATLDHPSFWRTHLSGLDYRVVPDSRHRSIFGEQIVETARFVRSVLISPS